MSSEGQLNITKSVIIRNNSIYVDGNIIYEYFKNDNFLNDSYESLDNNYPKFYKMDVLGKLGMLATHLLLKDSDIENHLPSDVGIVLSNSNSSLDTDIRYFDSVKSFPSPALFVYTLPNIVIGEISIRYKLKGENAFFIRQQFDADWLHFYISHLFQNNKINACIGGWIESIDSNHDVCLFLTERKESENGINFAPEKLNNIYGLGVDASNFKLQTSNIKHQTSNIKH